MFIRTLFINMKSYGEYYVTLLKNKTAYDFLPLNCTDSVQRVNAYKLARIEKFMIYPRI